MLAEIRRSLEYYTSQENGHPVTKIYITGGGSKMKGIKEFLTARLNLQIEDLDVFGQASLPAAVSGGTEIYQPAYGLGLRLLSSDALTMNLLPSDMIAALAKSEKDKWMKIMVGLGLFLVLEAGYWSVQKYMNRKALLDTLEQEYEGQVVINGKPFLLDGKTLKNAEVLERLETLEARKEALQNRFDKIQELETGKYDWIAILDAIRSSIPEGAWLTSNSFAMNPAGMGLTLESETEDSAKTHYRNVQENPYLNWTSPSIAVTRRKIGGKDLWACNASLSYNFPKAPGEADEYDEDDDVEITVDVDAETENEEVVTEEEEDE